MFAIIKDSQTENFNSLPKMCLILTTIISFSFSFGLPPQTKAKKQ
jgi:hypothetical protein